MEKDIGKLTKNDTTEIVLRVDDFADRRGLTIREFVTSERYTGFTKAGVRIMSKDFVKFKEMINSISEEDMKDIEAIPETVPEEAPEEQKEETSVEEKASEGEPSKELPDY